MNISNMDIISDIIISTLFINYIFLLISDIIISTKWSGVRANVEYQNHKGFEVCAYEQTPLRIG